MREILLKIYDNFSPAAVSVQWQQTVFPLKIISAIIILLLSVAIIIMAFRLKKNIKAALEAVSRDVEVFVQKKEEASKRWQEILDKLESDDESGFKMAVIEADKVFDELLKEAGYPGEDMGTRLKQITEDQLSNIDEVWQAHKVRNRIAHEPYYQLNKRDAKRAVEIYKRATEDLKTE